MIAVITLIIEKGGRACPRNDRAISLTSLVGKITNFLLKKNKAKHLKCRTIRYGFIVDFKASSNTEFFKEVQEKLT